MPGQYQLPQFIEHEAKVIGPFTLRRAAYLGVPVAIIFLLYFQLADNFVLFVLLAALLEAAGVALAFAKVQGKSIPEVMTHMLFFASKPKRYIWKRGNTKVRKAEVHYGAPPPPVEQPMEEKKGFALVRKSRIRDLATKVQTKKSQV